jgi:hypothetical protein
VPARCQAGVCCGLSLVSVLLATQPGRPWCRPRGILPRWPEAVQDETGGYSRGQEPGQGWFEFADAVVEVGQHVEHESLVLMQAAGLVQGVPVVAVQLVAEAVEEVAQSLGQLGAGHFVRRCRFGEGASGGVPGWDGITPPAAAAGPVGQQRGSPSTSRGTAACKQRHGTGEGRSRLSSLGRPRWAAGFRFSAPA